MVKSDILKASSNSLSAHILESVKIRTAVILNNFCILVKLDEKLSLEIKSIGLGWYGKKINKFEMGIAIADWNSL